MSPSPLLNACSALPSVAFVASTVWSSVLWCPLPDATVPAPRVRLVAYQRVRAIAPSESVLITLTVRPDSHAVVLDDGSSVYVADVVVQGGRLHLSVGGGQPSPHGRTVSATVAVSSPRGFLA